MRSILVPVALTVMLCFAAADASAQWMWRDASGRVTVSDRPPPLNVPASAIVARPAGGDARAQEPSRPATSVSAAATSKVSAEKVSKDPALEARRKKAEAEVAEQRKAEEQKNTEIMRDNCERARSAASTLESGTRVVRTTPNGEREFLDDKARADELARARQHISSNCKG